MYNNVDLGEQFIAMEHYSLQGKAERLLKPGGADLNGTDNVAGGAWVWEGHVPSPTRSA